MASKLLVVVGATGAQGGSVINVVLSTPELSKVWKIRGLSRGTTSPAAEGLKSRGIEVVKADTSDLSSLTTAFHGATVVFGVTNYWEHQSASHEIEQGKNIALACKEVGAFLIWSSLPSVSEASNSLHPLPYWDSKATVSSFIRSLDIPVAFVWLGWYMENFPRALFKLSPSETDATANTYIFTLPCPPTTLLPLIDCTTDLGRFVTPILQDPEMSRGRTVLVASQYLSIEDVVRVYNSAKREEWRELEFEERGEQSWLLATWGYFGGVSLEESVKMVDGTPKTWEDFVRDGDHPAWKALLK